MDATRLYNGVHLQRKKMFTLNPMHNLNSQIEYNWPESFRHQELSPLSKIKQRQSLQSKQIQKKHNQFVENYLSTNLNLLDSRSIKFSNNNENPKEKGQKRYEQSSQLSSKSMNPQSSNYSTFKLPKLQQQSSRRSSILSELISDRSQNYLNKILKERLKKYEF